MSRVPLVAMFFAVAACSKNAPPPETSPAAVQSAPVPASPPPATESAAPAPAPAPWTAKAVPFSSGTGQAFFDYIAYDPAGRRVLVPTARETGALDVYDTAAGTFAHVEGFKTREQENHGRKRMLGPSAVAAGDGVFYVGNRATSEICAIDAKALRLGTCIKLPSPIDGVAYVASAKEVWVTTPDRRAFAILDASKPASLKNKTTIQVEGSPEGFTVDEGRGIFYSNLEDKNRTLAIDVKTHKVKSTWSPGCSDDGPRGIAIDAKRQFLLVACTDGVRVLDAGHDGAPLGKLETGAGVDNIDWLDSKHLLFVAAGKTGQLSVVRVDDHGQPTVVATAATAERARNAVGDASGNAYVVDPSGPQLLVFPADPAW
jgi:DNA-binding beta-propeller fold protein YncE